MAAGKWEQALSQDQLTRVSAVVGVYKGLHLLFADDMADRWPRLKNSGPLFQNLSPIAAMQQGLKTRREAALRPAVTRVVDRRTTFAGTIEFPCLPALADHVLQRIVDCLSGFGHVFSREETQ